MRTVDWFDRNPKGQGWLASLKLRANEVVRIRGLKGLFRYSQEKDEHLLTPIEENRKS